MLHLKFQTKLALTIALSLIVSLLATFLLNSAVATDAIRARMLDVEAPHSLGEVAALVDRAISIPFQASQDIVSNSYIHDWVRAGEPDAGLDALTRYLDAIKSEQQADAVFYVSDATKRYITEKGVFKTIDQSNPKDQWFFRFVQSGKPHSLDIDVDEATGAVTLFINIALRVDGKLAAVAGLGVKLASMVELVERFTLGKSGYIFLIDSAGKVRVHPKSVAAPGDTLAAYFPDNPLGEQIRQATAFAQGEAVLNGAAAFVSTAPLSRVG